MENLRMRLNKTAKGTPRRTGFTLVELLVVIAIIAILSVTAYVALGGQTAKARNSRRMQDLSAIQSALEVYFVENYSTYPATGSLESELVSKYMPELPVDPIPQTDGSDNPYVYVAGPSNKTYQIGTIIEEEDAYTAYVVGNADPDVINNTATGGTTVSNASCVQSTCTVEDGKGDCLPYCPR